MTPLRLTALLLALPLAGCPKSAPPPDVRAAPVDAGVSEAERVAPRLDALEAAAAAVVKAQDEALWTHWTTGAPLDLAAATRGHETLFTKQSLATVRRARELRPQDARRLGNLERWLGGELLARGVAAESEAVAALEASVTFTVDGREILWKDLGRLLVTEKSAVKRRALWTAAHAAARRLEAALVRREEKAREVLAALELPAPLDFAAETRELDLDLLARQAEAALASTDDEWRTTLQALSDAEVKLPLAALTRADLPRVLKVPASVDAEFPRARLAERAVQTLGGLGAYGQPGLTLDLSDGTKKNPLPLTVAPALGDVRVSLKPAGGLRAQQAALGELGAALTLRAARSGSFALDRLTNPGRALRTSELLASLPGEDAWLEERGITSRAAVVTTVRAHRLFALRRAAGVVLAKLETHALTDEAEARARYVALMGRALGLQLPPEEGARWRVDTDDFLRSATQLQALELAGRWRAELGDGWWKKGLPLP